MPRHASPPVLGLTGGIGSGKSEALAAFAACGAATLSADEVVHALYLRDDVRAAVAERFGAGVMRADGGVDRAAVGERVFADAGARAFVEGLLHPLIGREREEWIARMRARVPAPPVIVCEVPLLYEAGLDDRFDAVVVITAGEARRRERVSARGQDFEARSRAQLPEDEKVSRADHVYVNEGSLDDLRAWVSDRCREYAGLN